MFRENKSHEQKGFFDIDQQLNTRQLQMWENSLEHRVYLNIFKRIDENDFEELYSKKLSRPNVPVNQLVVSLILKHRQDWTYNELFTNLNFNSLSRHAIGINSLNESVFAPASLFNFQNRVLEHFMKTGKDLFKNLFDDLTKEQLKEFGVDTTIQRGDSFLAGSNIFDYTRVQLLLELLQRLWRVLSEKDKAAYLEITGNYTAVEPSKYIYKLKRSDLPSEQEAIGKIYQKLYNSLGEQYSDKAIWAVFERVYKEHFTITEGKIILNKITSGALMSPDDEDATFRNKGRQKSKGFVVHASETAHPDNELNLMTDVTVHPNNTDDSVILGERLEDMLDLTPDLNEYHADGTYGSPKLDEQMKKHGIVQIVTGVRGRKPGARMIVKSEEDGVSVNCEGGQTVKAERTGTDVKGGRRFKVNFDYNKCSTCPLFERCNTKTSGIKKDIPKRVWYFGEKEILKGWRDDNYANLPEERRNIRPNVEATMKEMERGLNSGKLRVRGINKVTIYSTFTAIAVNIGRIHRSILKKAKNLRKKEDNFAKSTQKSLFVITRQHGARLAA